jgi:hypothetical protein
LQPMGPAEFYKASEAMYKTIQGLEAVLKQAK